MFLLFALHVVCEAKTLKDIIEMCVRKNKNISNELKRKHRGADIANISEMLPEVRVSNKLNENNDIVVTTSISMFSTRKIEQMRSRYDKSRDMSISRIESAESIIESLSACIVAAKYEKDNLRYLLLKEKNATDQYKIINDKVKSGEVEKSYLSISESDLKEATIERKISEKKLSQKISDINRIYKVDISIDDLDKIDLSCIDIKENDIPKMIKKTIHCSSEQRNLDRMRRERNRKAIPIDFSLDFENTHHASPENRISNQSVNLNIDINPKNILNIAFNAEEVKLATLRLEGIKSSINNEFNDKYLRIELLRNEIALLKSNTIPSREEYYKDARNKFNEGEYDVTKLLDASDKLNNVRKLLIDKENELSSLQLRMHSNAHTLILLFAK